LSYGERTGIAAIVETVAPRPPGRRALHPKKMAIGFPSHRHLRTHRDMPIRRLRSSAEMERAGNEIDTGC